jgi:hypothetical protein
VYGKDVLPKAPVLDDDDVARATAHACDADRPEAERVGAVHALRGATSDREAVSRRLVPLLNEPLLWLGSEVLACASGDDVAVGVDGARIVASPGALSQLQADGDGEWFCPDLGRRVVPIDDVVRLVHELPERPAWMLAPPHGISVLRVKDGARRPRTVTIGPDFPEVTIGRNADIELMGREIGQRHARLVMRDGKLVVVNVEKATGTFVNGRRINSPTVVREGDVIGISDAFLLVEVIVSPWADPMPATSLPLAPPPGTFVRVDQNRHSVWRDNDELGVVRYDPPTAAVIDRANPHALGVAVVVEGGRLEVVPVD